MNQPHNLAVPFSIPMKEIRVCDEYYDTCILVVIFLNDVHFL